MSWDCKFNNQALKDLQKIPKPQQKRIIQALTILAKDPHIANNNIKRLGGNLSGLSRLRIGRYRVIYLLDEDSEVISVKAVLLRNEKTYK